MGKYKCLVSQEEFETEEAANKHSKEVHDISLEKALRIHGRLMTEVK